MMILVLDDGSTFSGSGSVIFLNEEGREALEDYNDAKVLEGKHIEKEISIEDLLDAYYKVHGE